MVFEVTFSDKVNPQVIVLLYDAPKKFHLESLVINRDGRWV